MLFIVTATVKKTERGIESETETTYPVTHAVEADCEHGAGAILYDHYEKLSQTEPYGERYQVSDVQGFPPLSLATLRAT